MLRRRRKCSVTRQTPKHGGRLRVADLGLDLQC